MRKSLLALGVLSSALALASGDIWVWKSGRFHKDQTVDSITFENPLTAASHYNVNDKECHTPTINRITLNNHYLNVAEETLTTPILLDGQDIILHGTNLNYVDSVKIKDVLVYSKDWETCGEDDYYDNYEEEYVSIPCKSDTTLRLLLPSGSDQNWEGNAIFYVHNCTESLEMAEASFYDEGYLSKIKPEAYMFYNEFVPDGGILKVKGVGFDKNTTVTFQGTDGSAIPSNMVECKSANEIWAIVPAGVGESTFVTFKNANGETESVIRFRDTRNILLDFDTEYSINNMYFYGAGEKDKDGSYSITSDNDIVENYHSAGLVNQYGLLTNEAAWYGLSYAPSADSLDFWEDNTSSVFGQFVSEVKASNINDYVVKFEINVPKSGALEGMAVTLCFTSATEKVMYNSRNFAASFQPAEITWDKSDTVNGWKDPVYSKFYTDGWMTVTVPMSEFLYNIVDYHYLTAAANLANGWELPDDVSGLYANGGKSYAETYANKLSSEDDLFKYWGGFQMLTNPYDSGAISRGLDGYRGKLAIDNVRIIPNDGNGAIYPRSGYGVPSQHYDTNPRTKAYTNR